MPTILIFIRLFFFIGLSNSLAISYNLPKLHPDASWNTTPTIFTDGVASGAKPVGIFLDISNTVYASTVDPNQIIVWYENKTRVMPTISGNSYLWGVFATLDGDIYINDENNTQVVRQNMNGTHKIPVMSGLSECTALFVDITNTVYCSRTIWHKVIKNTSSTDPSHHKIVAGTGSPGPGPDELNEPFGIFVHTNFTLYVADCNNKRIQSFHPNQTNGTTLMQGKITTTVSLEIPRGIVLDADDNLYVVDSAGYIFRSSPNGTRCLVGCSESDPSRSDLLKGLRRLSFDKHGNIFATNYETKQILIFYLTNNSLDATTEPVFTSFSLQTTISTANKENPFSTVQSTNSSSIKATTITTITTSLETADVTETTVRMTTRKSLYFVPEPCQNKTRIGFNCSMSDTPCDLLKPCHSENSCKNVFITPFTYQCICSDEFHGDRCHLSRRLCQLNPCWNNGVCEEFQKTFVCRCGPGWTGKYCESKENYCHLRNITCQNRGVCRPLFQDFKCECLGINYYSGRFCEIKMRKVIMFQIAAIFIASIAIFIMISTASFFVVMDILKYCFGIDVTCEEREQIRRKKQAKKRRPVIQRFVYVNAQIPAKTAV